MRAFPKELELSSNCCIALWSLSVVGMATVIIIDNLDYNGYSYNVNIIKILVKLVNGMSSVHRKDCFVITYLLINS